MLKDAFSALGAVKDAFSALSAPKASFSTSGTAAAHQPRRVPDGPFGTSEPARAANDA
ncbi:hypothetical protein GCM10023192_83750 [Amycolatopsis samaneae]